MKGEGKMPQDKSHNLHHFMRQQQRRMLENYQYIREKMDDNRSNAGDQGEENWADLLRGWLPRTYEIVTRGQIIGQDGNLSPQVDVLVLKSVYPKQLIDENNKIFLAAGVAAAFECKNTLKASHIEKAVETCVKIKNLYPERQETPYKELHAPIVFGLLAHSHSWQGKNSTPEDNIENTLFISDLCHVSHPRQCLDLLCVADLTTWIMLKNSLSPRVDILQNAEANTIYMKQVEDDYTSINPSTSVGSFISGLTKKLAWENSDLRCLADYYQAVKLRDAGKSSSGRKWEANQVYSPETFSGLGSKGPVVGEENRWSEWFSIFP